MEILRTVDELQSFVANRKKEGATIGLVPTMGALHDGHLSLVHNAIAENDCVVASIFVNPVQFNNPADLATYPRTEETDFDKLRTAGVHAVFAPSVSEIYPEGTSGPQPVFDLGAVAEVMEGKFRPGHFQGVARIVSMLLRMSRPDRAYFGEKDFQQIAVIRRMVQTEGIEVEIVSVPIKRADDGLALSSRNALLSPEERMVAPQIHAVLKESTSMTEELNPQQMIQMVTRSIDEVPHCKVEYFEIVDGITLQPVQSWDDTPYIVGCITVYCGNVRLIDNITYRIPGSQK